MQIIAGFVIFLIFILIACLFIVFIVKKDRGQREPTGALFAAMGFGFLAVILALILNGIFVPQELQDSIGKGFITLSNSQLLISAITIGVIEESVKALPLGLYLYKKPYFNEFTDGVIYFGISAMTFSLVENVVYLIQFGNAVGLSRIVFLSFLHASFSAVFGLTIIYRKLLNKPFWFMIIGFLISVLLHSMYDFLSFKGGWAIIIIFLMATILNVSLFIIFRKAQKADEARGLSAIGKNKFCKQCGKPNPKQLLYCSYCGKLT